MVEPGRRAGAVRRRSAPGRQAAASSSSSFDGRKYLDYIAEHVEPWTYLKFPYYKKLGWPDGVYRVGPLGRLNVAEKIATPLAQEEYKIFQQLRGGKVVEGTLYYHYARLIEDLYALERVRELLRRPGHPVAPTSWTTGQVTNRRGRGRDRGAARHPVPSLLGGRERATATGQPDRGDRPQQLGHEQGGGHRWPRPTSTARTSPKAC